MTVSTSAKATDAALIEAIDAALMGSPILFLNHGLPLNPQRQPQLISTPKVSAPKASAKPGPVGVLALKPNLIEELTAEQFVDDLARRAIAHQAVQHPYLQSLATGDLPDLRFALRDFGRQYYAYSAHFPRYLTALISKLESPAHRAALMENLTEESGQYEQEELDELAAIGIQPEWIVGLPHPELFRRFRRALGVHDGEASEEELEVVCWREQFLAILSTGSAAEALGALGLGTETIVQTIYQPFVEAIGRLGMHPRDSVFFPLHTAVDDHHQATLRDIAIDLARTPQGRRDLAKGMQKALALRCSFWSWLHQRALQPQALLG